MLNLLAIPVWAWVAAALILVVAAGLIALLIVLDKKRKKNGDGGDEVAAESGLDEKPVKTKTEKTKTKTKKTVVEDDEGEEVKPAKTAKPAAQTATNAEEKTAKPAKPAAQTTASDEKKTAKPAGKVYHISKRKDDGKWQIKAAGAEKAIKLFDTQEQAIAYGKILADNQDASIMIHKLDGSFRKLTY